MILLEDDEGYRKAYECFYLFPESAFRLGSSSMWYAQAKKILSLVELGKLDRDSPANPKITLRKARKTVIWQKVMEVEIEDVYIDWIGTMGI